MGHVSTTKTLPVAADKIWASINDLPNWGDWLTIHAGWLETPPAELAVGARLVNKVFMLGMSNKIEWSVAEVDPGKAMSITGTGMAGVKCRFDFTLNEIDANTTEVVADAEFQGSLVVGALAKAVEKDGAKNLADSLDKLAQNHVAA